MRVAEFSDTFLPVVDGVGRVVSRYAFELGKRCEACYVIAPEVNALYRGGLPFDIVTYFGMPLPKSPQYRIGLPVADVHYRQRLSALSAELVHVHSPFIAGHEGMRFAKKRGLPLIGTFHSKYYDDFLQATGNDRLSQAGAEWVARFFGKCDQVWAVSRGTADVLRGYGYKGGIEIVDNGCDPWFPDRQAVAEAEEEFGIGDAPLLLFVGQMNWKKNIRRILEAAKILQEKGAAFQLVLAGQGPHRREIEETARALHLAGKLLFTGHITDPRLLCGLYARADLFVFPSLYDNAPMVVREAAAAGTPSLLVRGSCAAEVVRDGENGFLCEDTSEDAAAAILRLLSDPALRERAGEEAKKTIPRPWESVIDEVIGRYRELIKVSKK